MKSKAKVHREERKDKKKLLKDFDYVMKSEINIWFKRTFLFHFIDAWIDKFEDKKYDGNIFWSKKAIEKKIRDEHNKINGIKIEHTDTKIKKLDTFNNDHLVPKAIFEDIFIDGKTLDTSKAYKIKTKKRMSDAYSYYKNLRTVHNGLSPEEFHERFFNEFCISVTLTAFEHDNLFYKNSLPDGFYITGNKWLRYKSLEDDTEGEIEIYRTDFSNIKELDWTSTTFETLQKENIVSDLVNFDSTSHLDFFKNDKIS